MSYYSTTNQGITTPENEIKTAHQPNSLPVNVTFSEVLNERSIQHVENDADLAEEKKFYDENLKSHLA